MIFHNLIFIVTIKINLLIICYFIIYSGCLWHGKPAQLSIHYENGFTLLESTTGSVGREHKKLWSYPFEKLKMSSDDNNRLLWLDFGDSMEIVSINTEMC